MTRYPAGSVVKLGSVGEVIFVAESASCILLVTILDESAITSLLRLVAKARAKNSIFSNRT